MTFIGKPGSAEFLEGLDLKEEAFNRWLIGLRLNPAQLHALYNQPARPRPVAPTIAILPFRLIAGSREHEVLGDWLAEEICRSASRSNLLSVISHLSSRTLAQRSIDIAAVRRDLGADFCVSGSLRVNDGTAILDADLVECASGRILCTRRFVNTVSDFIGQTSEGIAEIVTTIGRTIADDAIRHAGAQPLQDLEDHRLLIAGVRLMHSPALRDFVRARELVAEATRRAPLTAEVHAWMGKWHILSVFNDWSTDPRRDTQVALDSTARALDIDPDNSFCLTIDGFAHSNLARRLDIASERYKAALRYNPNESLAWLMSGVLHAFEDDAEVALTLIRQAQRLSPLDPFGYFYDSMAATAHMSAGEYDRALEFSEKSLTRNNRHLSTLRVRIAALHGLGRKEELRAAGVELLRRQPGCTVAGYLRGHPAADFEGGRRVAQAMQAAGIP